MGLTECQQRTLETHSLVPICQSQKNSRSRQSISLDLLSGSTLGLIRAEVL